MAAFAAFVAIALAQVPDHCMVASWHVTPMCGRDLWQILVTSPEVLIFALFMIPDPRTVPDGQVARVVFGIIVAMLAVLLLGPTTLEFWTKTAILASLVIACALRFALVAFLAPFVAQGWRGWVFGGFRWEVPAALAVALLCIGALPVAAAAAALPPAGNAGPAPASSRVWILPPIPAVSIASNVHDFDPSITQKVAAAMAHDVVLDLIIESEARRAHDLKLAGTAADGDALTEFTDVIKQDITAKKIVQKTYTFDKISLQLFLPKFASQASRLVGITLHGTATLATMDASGNVLSKASSPYAKSWGLTSYQDGTPDIIVVDYTGLAPAP